MKVLVFEEQKGMSRHLEIFFSDNGYLTEVFQDPVNLGAMKFSNYDLYIHFSAQSLNDINTNIIHRKLPSIFIHCGGEKETDPRAMREGEDSFPFLGDLKQLETKIHNVIVDHRNWSKPSVEEIMEFESSYNLLEKEEASENFCHLIANRYDLDQVIFVDYDSWVDSTVPENVIPLDRRKKANTKVSMLSNMDMTKSLARNLCFFLDKVAEGEDYYCNEKYQCHLLRAGRQPVGYLIYSAANDKIQGDAYSEYFFTRFPEIYNEKAHYKKIMEESYLDDVTSLYNQKYLPVITDSLIKQCKQTGNSFSVLFIDIDHFKKVNDSRGHIVGSAILSQLAEILKLNIRDKDYAFRYGGDEFLLLLHNANATTAKEIAERMREQVENHDFYVNEEVINITLSIGIASFPEHAKTKEEVIEMADEAMYSGKNKSRNIVFVAS